MTGEKSGTPRKPRADSERNRRRLLDAATAAFAAVGPTVSLEEIARRAGLGIGTLYRHFPERDALLAEVYRDALRQLADAAPRLAAEHPPVEALRRWMRVFVDFLATKKVIAPALEGMAGGTSELYAGSLAAIRTALSLLVDRAVANGDIRIDIDPLDLLWAVAGVVTPDAGAGRRDIAYQVIDIILAGLKAR
ncbi:TetR/AcrR family transcriptional regulator [Rhodoplanes sp. TEM]|uniref:TetR/AcrR family transcriptional regulator n=1 Tax=Rhodoplanes tepidamans TaxID=200616 RepID=A0ABT5J482_RHOTP|nr:MULTISPECIES: TetR/AcrR family transcriptional regulator [Rhodoplanes]MDC7784452.1 TetR/AcrR family transcriptional regulator [Rhodoplanes tepidamans]MDC7983482.1 TetR/AcrR family transcriptional regulator [Rhodoplanes sp. TEM]MDQ0356959.1 AcrR family transcriptional regulator [Rhodoplanes tepidamans]